jgi:hypothetical protein
MYCVAIKCIILGTIVGTRFTRTTLDPEICTPLTRTPHTHTPLTRTPHTHTPLTRTPLTAVTNSSLFESLPLEMVDGEW